VRVRDGQGGAWSAPWHDGEHHYFTCHDALAAGKRQAVRMIGVADAPDPG
jgi:hypothetical protein